MSIRALTCFGVLLACSGGLRAADVILNEYNAVGGTQFLEDGAEDTYWGRVEGNGGDWFELAVITDHLDMRGWQLVISDNTGSPDQTLTLTGHDIWSDLRSGTIVTVSEELGNNASEYSPETGQWWLNVKAADGTNGTYITASNFRVNSSNWQITILDASGVVVFGPAGEGIQPPGGVTNQEVCKLEEDPSASVTPLSNYTDGQSSTFGSENIWQGGAHTQDFSVLRSVIGQCTDAADCDDGEFCNGPESCEAGTCQSGADPCSGPMCDEVNDVCADCLSNADCNDGDACTADTCENDSCHFATIPGCACSRLDDDDDGVNNCNDECAYTPADETPDEHGCGCSQLDDDEDGTDNCDDLCADTPGGEAADATGCGCSQLDDDEDGVENCVDECPDTAAGVAPDEGGCGCSQLDDDEDGIDNCGDLCPDTAAGDAANAEGCSCLQLDPTGDADGDGVLNCLDLCGGTPLGEEADVDGCSCLQLDPDGDDDGDAVPNCHDACPSTSAGETVDDSGCSVTPPDSPSSDNDNDNAADQEPPAQDPVGGDDASEPTGGEEPDGLGSGSSGGGGSARRGQCGVLGLWAPMLMTLGLFGIRLSRQRRRGGHAPGR
ncbi:MAG: MSCRAMM family adhesin [Planctomycetota bacterium]|jgi:hypothetical protein